MTDNNTLLLIGGGVLLYFFLNKQSTGESTPNLSPPSNFNFNPTINWTPPQTVAQEKYPTSMINGASVVTGVKDASVETLKNIDVIAKSGVNAYFPTYGIEVKGGQGYSTAFPQKGATIINNVSGQAAVTKLNLPMGTLTKAQGGQLYAALAK